MRLFLSSYRAGNYPGKLVELFGKNTRVAVITNAKDYKPPKEREIKVKEVLDFFLDLGLKPDELELKKYFTSQVNWNSEMDSYQSVWLAGGNVFLLRRALKQSGIDKFLYDSVRKNEIIYGGESAGAMVAGPTLRYSEMEGDEDNPNFVTEEYEKEILWDGLHFIDYVPVPHHRAPDYGLEIDSYIHRLDGASIPHKEITDNQAIVINGFKEEFLE